MPRLRRSRGYGGQEASAGKLMTDHRLFVESFLRARGSSGQVFKIGQFVAKVLDKVPMVKIRDSLISSME